MRSRHILSIISALLMLALSAAFALPAYATQATAPTTAASSAPDGGDVSPADVVPHEPVEFIRVQMVPLNVDIPYFYQEVINVSGMYVFALPDGTIYKRIYGARDNVYGWYEPDEKNIIYTDSPMIDTRDDIEMYELALKKAHVSYSDLHVPTQPTKIGSDAQDYSGILPPESGIAGLSALFGIPLIRLAGFIGLGAVVLCIIILLLYNRRKGDPDCEPRQEYYIID